MSGGSSAPIENSPPGTQTIPFGTSGGCAVGFGMVAAKPTTADRRSSADNSGAAAAALSSGFGSMLKNTPPTISTSNTANSPGTTIGGTDSPLRGRIGSGRLDLFNGVVA